MEKRRKSNSISDSIGTTDNSLSIGKGFGTGGGKHWFNGVIDEIRISDGKTTVSVDSAMALSQHCY